MCLENENLSTIPIWVQLPGLAMEYWGERCIRKIAWLLGNVLKVDKAAKNKERLRALVEMDIKNEIPDELFFTNEYDELVKQPVRYDLKPIWCNKCQQIGHQVEGCHTLANLNHKKPTRKE